MKFNELVQDIYDTISPIIDMYERLYGITIDFNLDVEINDNIPS